MSFPVCASADVLIPDLIRDNRGTDGDFSPDKPASACEVARV